MQTLLWRPDEHSGHKAAFTGPTGLTGQHTQNGHTMNAAGESNTASDGESETVVLCQRTEMPDGEARRFDVEGHRIALVRIGGDFYAIGDRCSHGNYSLSQGWVWPDECALECPQHSSSFDLRTGRPNCFPATVPVPVYEVHIRGEDVAVVL